MPGEADDALLVTTTLLGMISDLPMLLVVGSKISEQVHASSATLFANV